MCTCGRSATAIFSKPDQLERCSHTRLIAPKLGTAFSPIFNTIPPPKLPLHVSAATSQFSQVVKSIVNSESLTNSSVNKELVSIFNHRTHRVKMSIVKRIFFHYYHIVHLINFWEVSFSLGLTATQQTGSAISMPLRHLLQYNKT